MNWGNQFVGVSCGPVVDEGFVPGFPSGPQTIIEDTFTEGSNTALASHVIAPVNVPASSWVESVGAWTVFAASDLTASDGTGGSRASVQSNVSDGTITVNIKVQTAGGPAQGIAFRWQTSTDYWYLAWDSTNQLYLVDPGGTTRDTDALTLTAGNVYQFKVILNGTSITGICEGVTVTFASADNQTETIHGMRAGASSSVEFDDFKITDATS